MNDYTKFIYPLKLHEYLAAGRPVVTTPIRSVQEFAGVIELAQTDQEWSDSLTRSLSPEAQSANQVRVRQEVARGFDWDRLVGVIARHMCDGLGLSPRDHLQAGVAGGGTLPQDHLCPWPAGVALILITQPHERPFGVVQV